MILLLLAIWYGYKKARDTGRNAFLWAAISGGVFLGIQFGVALALGVLAGVGQELWGWEIDEKGGFNIVVSLIAVVLSIIGLMLVFRYLDKVPDEGPVESPPPPPTFNENDRS